MKLSYTKMFAVWFTVGVALAFLLFASALIPGFNIGAVPTFIVFSTFSKMPMYTQLCKLHIETVFFTWPRAAHFFNKTSQKNTSELQYVKHTL